MWMYISALVGSVLNTNHIHFTQITYTCQWVQVHVGWVKKQNELYVGYIIVMVHV